MGRACLDLEGSQAATILSTESPPNKKLGISHMRNPESCKMGRFESESLHVPSPNAWLILRLIC
jgi:hypothetical protein